MRLRAASTGSRWPRWTFLASAAAGAGCCRPRRSARRRLPSPSLPRFPSGEPKPPDLTSTAALVMDADSGQVLFSKNADERLPMASTTKIMTAIVVLESLDLDTKVMVSRNAHFQSGSVVGLQALDVVTVEQLLYWLLVFSGNDAAVALAEKTSGSVDQVRGQDERARPRPWASPTRISPTPTGSNATGHYSSCTDLATMARYAMKNETFRKIVNTPVYDLPHPGAYTPAEPKNSNALLTKYDWITGVKTGSTPDGRVLRGGFGHPGRRLAHRRPAGGQGRRDPLDRGRGPFRVRLWPEPHT